MESYLYLSVCAMSICELVYILVITVFMDSQLRMEKVTGKKGPATALELGTYALSWSFSHASIIPAVAMAM